MSTLPHDGQLNLSNQLILIDEAHTTRDLNFNAQNISANQIYNSFLAALIAFAEIISTEYFISINHNF